MAGGQKLRDVLRALAEEIVLADPEDAASWESVRSLFNELARLGTAAKLKDFAAEARRASRALASRAKAGGPFDEELLATLTEAVDRLQGMTDGRGSIDDEEPQPNGEKQTAEESEDNVGDEKAAAGADDAVCSDEASKAIADAASFFTPEELVELRTEFIVEANEHLQAADTHMLALEDSPEDRAALDGVFRNFHSLKGNASFVHLTPIQSVAHEAEGLLTRIRKGNQQLSGEARDSLFDAIDSLRRMVSDVTADPSAEIEAPSMRFPGLVERLRAATGDAGAPDAVSGPAAGRDRTAPAEAEIRVSQGTVRVDAERLDRLVDMIGELAIAESMLSQLPELRLANSPDLERQLSSVQKITRGLQEMASSLRMVPLRGTFQRMARLARDVARKTEKGVEFTISGGDTELDKSVVEQISDPLIHLIRNAIDHGLEADADERRAAAKPETGRVQLRAFHRGGNVYIEIEDDGRGLDRTAILKNARSLGLVGEEEQLEDEDLLDLIFEPGVTTARAVTSTSGRGVGMDVVKRNVELLRGHIDARSVPGEGTTFSIRLPLTLAIIEGMVARVGTERYVIPTSSVVRSVRPKAGQLKELPDETGELIKVQEGLLHLLRLGDIFGVEECLQDPTKSVCIVVEEGNRRFAVMIDELIGKQQVVIKGLGPVMQGLPGLAGGAILPDGNVGLIVDVASLESGTVLRAESA